MKSIRLQLLVLIIGAFVLITVGVVILSDYQLTRIIDNSQDEIISERLDTILGVLGNRYDKLQETVLVAAYEEGFKQLALDDLWASYYDRPDQEVYPFIIDEQGAVVLHPRLRQGDTSLAGHDYVRTMLSGQGGEIEYEQDDERHWLVYKRFEGWNWVVGYTMPLDVKYADARQFQAYLLLTMGALGVLVMVSMGLLIQVRFIRPLTGLTATTSQIAGGDLQLRSHLDRADEIGILARAFNAMADQLAGSISTLEDRVSERTRDLEIAVNVSRQVTTVLELDNLLPQLADQTRTGFDLYHVAVYLYDAETETLKLCAATGEAGRQMLEANVFFRLGTPIGLVPRAARARRLVIVNNVMKHIDFLPNPMLPSTRAEAAFPMMVGPRLLGVLDLQSEHENRFSQDDQRVLSSLADQTAVAVRNAQLYTEARAARAEAERANRVKSQFLAAMSHELRTPLNGVLNFTHFVASGMLGPVNERQIEILQKAIANGEHLLALINDVLDISKIESGSLTLFVEDNVNLVEELEAALAATELMRADKPVKICREVAHNLPPIRADRRRVRQIMLNLLSNASKFTRRGQIITRLYERDSAVVLEVEDTGPGIDPSEWEKIFEVFRQTEIGLRQHEGTGLGLPISRRLAEAHGGRLWLESVVEQGSTFYVELPVQSAMLTPTLQEEAQK